MRIDAHENADKARLRRDPSGALRSNYRPSVGPYALNGRGRDAYIDGLERQRSQLLATGDRDGAKRYAIQAEFERAAQVADMHQRQADAAKVQENKDEHMRRAYEARAQMTEAQLKLAELDKRCHTEWEPSAEARAERFAAEVEQRKAEERKLAEQLAAERNSEDFRRQVEAREQGYRERIQPDQQDRYDALVDDARKRFADIHGKDRETYVTSDRERELTHKLIVEQGYGHGPLSERIREVRLQEASVESNEPRLDAKRFTEVSDRAAADSSRNDQLLRQLAPNEQSQRSEPVESVKMVEAGYIAQRYADHIAYTKEGQEKPAVRDYGDRISADPKQLQNEESRREVIAMVGERFPNGFQIRTSDEERKLEYAREAVRQGLGDKVKNPELREFINDYKQQHAEEQRVAQGNAQRNAEPQRQVDAIAERDGDSKVRQAPAVQGESRSQGLEAEQSHLEPPEQLRAPIIGASPLDMRHLADPARVEPGRSVQEQAPASENQVDETTPALRAPTLGSSPILATRDNQLIDAAPAAKQSFDWGPGAFDPSDSEVARLDEQRRQSESRTVPMHNEDARHERQEARDDSSETEGEGQTDVAQTECAEAEAEPDLSHLPEEVAQSLRESMAAEAELRARRDQETEQESQQQSHSQTL